MIDRVALVIDDEVQIRRVVRNALAQDFARVLEASAGGEGIDLAAAQRPALIVLDLGLPDMTGIEVCREIRRWSAVPLLVLSARQSDDEKVALLDAGADDYVTKPFSTTELQARVRALLRRVVSAAAAASVITSGALAIDITSRVVTVNGAEVHLTPTEYELLRVLASNAGRTMTHHQLFASVWPGRTAGDAQAYLRVHVANLRRKIEDDVLAPRHIITEPGVGYRFVVVA